MDEELISVVIPTYGRPKNLRRAIKSVYNQSYSNIEIIVVDDNDSDSKSRLDTEKLINEIGKENLIYVKHKVNKNGAVARNTGISKAKGDYIAFLDDDDEFEKDKLKCQLYYLKNNTQFKACYCNSVYYKYGEFISKSSYNREGNITKDILLLNTEYNSSTLFFCAESIKSINGFDESFIRNQDYEVMIRFLRYYKVGIVDDFLVKRHVDDIRNQPSFRNYRDIRLKFLNKFKLDIEKFSEKTQREIIREVYFDLSYYALKRKEFGLFFFYFFKSKPNLTLFRNNMVKFIRLIRKKMADYNFK